MFLVKVFELMVVCFRPEVLCCVNFISIHCIIFIHVSFGNHFKSKHDLFLNITKLQPFLNARKSSGQRSFVTPCNIFVLKLFSERLTLTLHIYLILLHRECAFKLMLEGGRAQFEEGTDQDVVFDEYRVTMC